MDSEVYNNLTKRLDDLSDRGAKASKCMIGFLYRHYLYEPYRDLHSGEIAIRVPGGTVGTVFVDHKHVITHIAISTDYVVEYNKDVNETINKEFRGKVLELLVK